MAKICVLLYLLLTVIKGQVEGCVETFPDLLNSITVCSNLTKQCTVSCVENHIYYDGDTTKTYSCNDDNIWSPFVPKTGCLDQTRTIFWMRFNVSYRTTQVAAFCLQAHQQALAGNEDVLTQQVSHYCNNTLINVGRISINKTTSTTTSFKINTVFELEIGDSSTKNIVKEVCRQLLIINVKSDNFMVYGDSLECTTGTSNLTKTNATAESDISRCPSSYLLVVDSENDDYCVPNIPVVGVESFLYSANISQDIVLHCALVFGSSLSSVYWQHNGLNLTYSNKKYNGSTIDSPSLMIYNVTYDDDGEYTCNVGSGEGSSPVIMLNILARVEDIPDVAIKKDEYVVIAGGNITLECTVISFPEVDDVVWLRNTSGTTEQITADGIKFSRSNSTSPSLTISSADLADSGMYTCTATNVAGTGISIPAELYVSGDLPTVHTTDDLYTVVLGNNITMNCNYSSDPPVTHVQWKYNNSDSLSNIPIGKGRYTGSIPSHPSLTITNTTFQDSGMYLCMVTNYLGSDVSDSIILQIIGDPPIVDVSPLTYSVIIGDNQTMMCNVTGIPDPLSVSWLKNETTGMNIISSIGVKYDGGNLDYPSLIVTDTANTDRGWYICTATNLAGTSYSEPAYLNVTGDEPYVEIPSETFSVVFGNDITINCSVSSHPAVTSIQWQWNTTDGIVDIVIDDHIYSGATTMEPSLMISAANFTHIGMYRCIAINRVGIGFSNFTYLSVSGDIPDIHVLQTSYTVIVTDNITMACNVSASPEVTRIGWLRNTTNNETTAIGMSNDKYKGGTIDDQFLTIWNVNNDDEGWYICTAENLIGDAISEQIYLNVTGDIPKVQIQEDSYHIILGENVTMGCEIYSHPLNTHVFWLHKTSEVFTAVTIDNVTHSGSSVKDPSLTITGVRFSDSGEYICVAVNFVGESRSNATTLNVTGDPPLVSVVTTQYNVIEDHNITLSCNVSGVPDVYAVSWKMNATSGSVNTDRLTGGTITDPSLTVGDTELGDTGWYTCTATNLAGTTYGKPLYLNVTEKCTNYVPTVSDAVLDCVYSKGSGSCRLTCITSYIFREGDSSRPYTCTGKNDWTPPLPMPTCVETVPSTYILIINITYKVSTIALYCQKSHDNAVVNNYDAMIQQLSSYCNNELLTVGPIVINSTVSITSSFEITTSYVIIIGNASISKYSKIACGSLVQLNVDRETLLVYGNDLQCETGRSTVNKTVGSFISKEATCPDGFSLVDETYVCVSDIPRIGSTTPLYTTSVGDNVTLYCDVVSELAVTSVYWQFIAYGTTETSVITTTNDNRYTGGTPQEESLTISNVSFTDIGIYKCVAVNKVGIGTGPNIELAVTTTVQDRPMVEIPSPQYNVILGDNITLVCTITSDLSVTKIEWQKKRDGIFTDVYIDNMTFHGSSTSDPSLTLIGARFIDEGVYLCIATNYAGSENSNITTLNVTGDAPVISIGLDQYTVQFGDNVTLLCDMTGVPAVTGVLWLRNDSGHVEIINTSLINYSGASVSKPSLTILMVRITDEGWYICTGTNLAGTATSEQMYLNVTANKPVITIPHIRYDVTAGDNITLECIVFAYPVVLSSSWSRNVTSTFQNIVPGDISEPSLTIKFVKLTDSGVYVCQSTNDAGTTHGTPIYLNVIGGLPDVTMMSTNTVLYGNNITLGCIITAIPNITSIKWQRDISGAFVDTITDSVKYLGATLSNHSLTVANVKFTDDGRYKCIGTNFVGTGSDITTLIVDGGIPRVYVSSTVYHVNIANNVTMHCNVSGSPGVVTMSWKSNTTSLTSNRHSGAMLSNPSLTISNVNVRDGGWYVCTATNIVGIGRSMPVYLNVTGDEICTEEVFPTINNAATTCSGSLEFLCTITCNDRYVTRSGNVTVYFRCENNLWRPPLPPQGCIGYVLPYVEYKIQVVYKVTELAEFCLSSHEQIINSLNSTFAQQATDACNNEYVDIGTLEITDMKSTTSSFSITTMYTVKSKMNTATKVDRDLCELFLPLNLKKSVIFTYTNTLSCNSVQASVNQTTGSLVSTGEICLGGSSSVVTSRETYCVSDVPSVVILKPSYIAEKGDSITLECNVESNLNVISVYWLHNISGVVTTIYGSETTKYSGSSPLVPSLTVSNVDFTDIGLYTCIAENNIGTGTSAPVLLNVIERVRDLPVITTTTTSLQFSVGSTATLHCSVNDRSEPSMIFWSLNTNGKYQIVQPFTLDDRYTGSTTISPSLVINDVVEEDTGNYTCHAVNILGVAFGEPIQFTIKGLVTGGNPTVGQSVDDIGILSCVQTFGYLLLFAAIGVVILTFTTILICIYVPNDTSSLVQNIGQWKLSDKIAIIVIELYLSIITSCAVAGIYTIVECSEDITGATIRLTAVAIVPGIALAACYLGICTYIQFKRYKKIAVFSDSKGMTASTSPVPDDHCQIKSWRPYQHSELPVDKHEHDSSTEDKGTAIYANESDIYASTFRSEPLVYSPSDSTAPGKHSLPPIDYKEHSEERMKRRRRRKKKRKKELFNAMNESNEEL